jgi:hypothetical protein
MELGKYKLAMRPKKYLTREFVVYKEAPEAMDDVITEEQNTIDTMPSQAPVIDNYMPEMQGMEDPSLRQVELADGGIVERQGYSFAGLVKETKNKLINESNSQKKFQLKQKLNVLENLQKKSKNIQGAKSIENLILKKDKLGRPYLSDYIEKLNVLEDLQNNKYLNPNTNKTFTPQEWLQTGSDYRKKFRDPETFLEKKKEYQKQYMKQRKESDPEYKQEFLKKKKEEYYSKERANRNVTKKLAPGRDVLLEQRNRLLSYMSRAAKNNPNYKDIIKEGKFVGVFDKENKINYYEAGYKGKLGKNSKLITEHPDYNDVNNLAKLADRFKRELPNKAIASYFSAYERVPTMSEMYNFLQSDPRFIEKMSPRFFQANPLHLHHQISATESPSKKIQLLLQDKNDQAGKKLIEFEKGNITEQQLNKDLKKLNTRYYIDGKPLGAMETSPETQLRTAKSQTTKLFNKTLQENPELVEQMTKRLNINLNPTEKKVFSNFGNKVSMGLDPTDVLKMLPEKEYQIMKGAMSKVGNLTTMGVRGAQELLVGTGPVGLGITAALTVPFMVADLAEGKRFSEALQNQASALTFGFIPEADKRIIEEIGGSEAGVGFEIQQNIDKLKILQNDLREAEKRTSDDIMDPEAELAQSNFVENTRKSINKTFQDLLPYLNEQGQIIAPEYNAYLQASNKAEQERAYQKGIGDLQAYNVGFDDISISEEGPFQQDIDKLLKGKKQLEKSYSKILSADDLINQYAYGGRVNFEKGGDPKDKAILPINPMMDEGPQDPSKRKFIQGAGGVGLAGLLLGTGLLKLAKSAAVPSKIGSMIKNTTAPSWMEALITKVMKEGTDIPVPKRPGVTTEKISMKELEFKNPENGKTEIITLKIDEAKDTIDVDYIGDNTLAGQGVTFKLSPKQKIVDKGNYLTSEKVKGEYQFSAHEAEPKVVNWDGDIEFDGENGVRTIIDLNSDISGLKSFVTGGKGVDKKVAKIKRETVDKIEKNPAEYIEEGFDYSYYDPSLPTE